MAYRAYQPDRRRRRRRWLLITLTLVVLVAGIAFLVSRETEQRGRVEFFAAADEASSLHRQSSDLLTDTLAKIGPLLTRQEVTRRFDTIEESATQAQELLDIEVPSRVANAYGNLSAASTAWFDGVVEVRRVVLGIIDGDIVEAAETQMRTAFDSLRVGDIAYERFRSSIDALPSELEAPQYEPLRYTGPDPADPLLYDAQNVVLRIQAAYNLAPRVDIGVVGMTDPEPAGDRQGVPILPYAASFSVNAVVSNLGNEDAAAIEVRLEVLDVDENRSSTRSQSIENIAPGASTTVTFSDVDIAPGGLYQATVSVTIEGDADPDNDTWSMTFIWNAES